MRETWYVLENGHAVDPNECSFDDAGILKHKGGDVVAMRSPDVPMSRGVDVDEVKPVEVKPAPVAAAPPKATADMRPAAAPKPKAKPGYKTRQAKSR